ncbi:hypothetical protein EX30DRAFT_36141 [Ascodesmis nigricans]|uniref:Uncharacterized protein n=1 Tax=Ascodesmis nigricans TaxID=341454 RepID=A0A4S2MWM8_9PEZI|nr:hypothetical protein EX30DRAFT_36141 [Ascodesmis nigricans]
MHTQRMRWERDEKKREGKGGGEENERRRRPMPGDAPLTNTEQNSYTVPFALSIPPSRCSRPLPANRRSVPAMRCPPDHRPSLPPFIPGHGKNRRRATTNRIPAFPSFPVESFQTGVLILDTYRRVLRREQRR